MQLIAEVVYLSPEIRNLQANDEIGCANNSTGALCVIQRVQRRKVHAAPLVDHRSLQCFGEFDEERHCRRSSCKPIRNEDRIFCSNKKTREFRDGPAPYRLTLLPAGHIFGSAMALLEAARIEPTARAENVPVEGFAAMARAFDQG